MKSSLFLLLSVGRKKQILEMKVLQATYWFTPMLLYSICFSLWLIILHWLPDRNGKYWLSDLFTYKCWMLWTWSIAKSLFKRRTNKQKAPKQIKQQESDISGYFVLNLNILNCFNLHLTTKTFILIILKHI